MIPDRRRHAVIRADASARIGGGHVVRCSALAEELASRGWAVAFAATPETFEVAPEISIYPDRVLIDAQRIDDTTAIRNHWPDGFDLLIVDHYGLDAPFEATMKDVARTILVIDDFPTRDHAADFLVDTTLGRREADYSGRGAGVLLCGTDYALLRRPFRDLRASALRRHRSVTDGRRVLVSLGLTDPDDATSFVLRAIDGLVEHVDVVLGEHARHRSRVSSFVDQRPGWRFHAQVPATAMASLLVEADVVIGAAGSSAYERCCLGKPMLLLQIAANQAGNVKALVEAGVAVDLWIFGEASQAEVRNVLTQSIADRDALDVMGLAAARLVDGQGVIRVVDAIETALAAASPRP